MRKIKQAVLTCENCGSTIFLPTTSTGGIYWYKLKEAINQKCCEYPKLDSSKVKFIEKDCLAEEFSTSLFSDDWDVVDTLIDCMKDQAKELYNRGDDIDADLYVGKILEYVTGLKDEDNEEERILKITRRLRYMF